MSSRFSYFAVVFNMTVFGILVFTSLASYVGILPPRPVEVVLERLMNPKPVPNEFTSKELELATTHEAGHALVAALLIPETMGQVEVYSHTAPNGAAGRLVCSLPAYANVEHYKRMLAVMCAGAQAEDWLFQRHSDGVGTDLQKAHQLAMDMVTKLGMSEKFPLRYIDYDHASAEVLAQVDAEVATLLSAGCSLAKVQVAGNLQKLKLLRDTLFIERVLPREKILELVKGG